MMTTQDYQQNDQGSDASEIQVNDPTIVNGDSAEAAPEPAIDIKQLSPQAKKELLKQLANEERAEKQKIADDKKAYKQLQNEFLERNIDSLVKRQESMENEISGLFKDYNPILELKKQVFGAEVKDQDSHTITHPDGSSSITIGYNVSITFDGTESAGVQKIKDFLATLPGEDENAKKLSKALNVLLKPNGKTGMLNPGRVIQISQMRDDFRSTEFNEGVDIILAAQNKVKTTMYVSGFKMITLEDGRPKKVEFRFTV